MRNLLLLIVCLPLTINAATASYQKYEYSDPDAHKVHVLTVSIPGAFIILEHALEQREPVSHMASRTNAIAGINAGFFRRGGVLNGKSLGLLKIGPTLFADPELERGALVWNCENDIHIQDVKIGWQLVLGDQAIPISTINQPYAKGTLAIYLPSFGNYTYAQNCTQYTVVNNMITTTTKTGWAAIACKGFVIAADDDCVKNLGLAQLKPGQKVSLRAQTFLATYMVDGAGALIKNGVKQTADQIAKELSTGNALVQLADEASINYHDAKQLDWLINTPNPRTAVGIVSPEKLVFVVVEGRQGSITGLTLPQLATFMRTKLGCTQAINLGGGGDSTLVFQGTVMNTPSGSSQGSSTPEERPVSDAILVFAKST